MSCWLWPWALSCALAMGMDPGGMGLRALLPLMCGGVDSQALFQASGG